MSEEDKRQVGRPRQYESTAAKVSAFRKRQGEAGYLRKEVLVRSAVADKLAALAKAHEVSLVDVASAMLEHGLSKYEQDVLASPQEMPMLMTQSQVIAPQAQSFVGSVSGSAGSALRAGALAFPAYAALSSSRFESASGDATDPIQAFFAARKDSTK